MKGRLFIAGLVAVAAAAASGAVILQEDFTAAQNGTLPASLTASYDGGSDVVVVPLATMQPTIGADHTGGDGYVCRVGDLGSSGGGYNWIYPTSASPQSDVRVAGWVYVDWTQWDSTPLERDYMIMARMANTNPQVSPTRQGYFFLVTANSSWTGITPNPPNFKPFLMKKVSTSHAVIGTYGTNDVTTGWHYFELEINGSNLVGKVDGTTVASGTDTAYTAGNVAWGYYDDNGAASSYPYAAAWDNIVYETTTPSSASDWALYE